MYQKKRLELKETRDLKKHDISKYLGDEPAEDRICVVMPRSIGDIIMATSLLEDIQKKYNKLIYFAALPQYFYILEGNPFIHKVIPYFQEMEDLLWMEGNRYFEPHFHMAFILHLGTQILQDYTHHGFDVIGGGNQN